MNSCGRRHEHREVEAKKKPRTAAHASAQAGLRRSTNQTLTYASVT
jgi:hypothetical protein